MKRNNPLIFFTIILGFSFIIGGCSASKPTEEIAVKKNVQKKEEYSSLTGIEKKSLINQTNLETLTNIVSEYKNSSIDRDEVMTKIIELINTPYLWGGTSTYGIDCSGFVQMVYKKALDIDLPRTSIMQSTVGDEVKREDLKFGDLVFFNTMGHRISHVGIYLGETMFAQSSSSGGVKVSSLNEDYYNSRFVTARRVIK